MTNVVLEAICEVREDLVLILQDGMTPKDIRSGGSKVGKIDRNLTYIRNAHENVSGSSNSLLEAEEALKTLEYKMQGLPWNSKTKAAELLEETIANFDELEGKAESEKSQSIARLPELEAEISESLRIASGALVRVGHLLNEAREEFDSANDFLAWAKERFEFKKAYVYRLMKVADDFPTSDSLAGQSINVLHKLAGMPEEVKQAARQKVEDGETLTGKEVDKLTGKETDNKDEELPESTGVDETGKVTVSGPDLGDDTGAPWSSDTGKEVELGSSPKPVPGTDPEVTRLRELVSELQAELAAARQEREGKAKSKAVAPALPQFESPCMYARLGLSAEQGADPAEVRKAFRALVKAGYNSQHESHGYLVEAKDTLMAVAEAA